MRRITAGILRTYALYFAWMITITAMAVSLYFSEVLAYIPCKLCWYQRIFMYPQVILLGIASYRNDRRQAIYLLPLNIIGGLIALYHYLLQKVPGMDKILPCSSEVPCSKADLNWFGFITFPLLSLIAFLLITVLLLIARKQVDE